MKNHGKTGIVVVAFAFSKTKDEIGSQTMAGLKKGVDLFLDMTKHGESVEIACSGMGFLPKSSPKVFQKKPMYKWIHGYLESQNREDLFSRIRYLNYILEDWAFYDKTCGNALEILRLVKQCHWVNIIVCDRPGHWHRLDIALQYISKLTGMDVDITYVPTDVDGGDSGQLVTKYRLVYWLYELANLWFYLPFQLAHRRNGFKRILQE
ncbi:MAG: hypothetical protein WAW33_00510 [Minisyncoccia bacterium]